MIRSYRTVRVRAVWLYRGPGLTPKCNSFLRGQKEKRLVACMEGWSHVQKRFVLKLPGGHTESLAFSQTGVVQIWEKPNDHSDSDSPKACSDSSDEEEK